MGWEVSHNTPGRPGHGVARSGRRPERGRQAQTLCFFQRGKIVAIVQRLTAEAEEQLWSTGEVDGAGHERFGNLQERFVPAHFRGDNWTCQSQKSLPWVAPPGKHFQRWGRRWPTSC